MSSTLLTPLRAAGSRRRSRRAMSSPAGKRVVVAVGGMIGTETVPDPMAGTDPRLVPAGSPRH